MRAIHLNVQGIVVPLIEENDDESVWRLSSGEYGTIRVTCSHLDEAELWTVKRTWTVSANMDLDARAHYRCQVTAHGQGESFAVALEMLARSEESMREWRREQSLR